jgi:hypothetical protein
MPEVREVWTKQRKELPQKSNGGLASGWLTGSIGSLSGEGIIGPNEDISKTNLVFREVTPDSK